MLRSLNWLRSLFLVGTVAGCIGCGMTGGSPSKGSGSSTTGTTGNPAEEVQLELVACDGSANQIRGCVNNTTGALRILSSSTQYCTYSERALCWNQVGTSSLSTITTLSYGNSNCPTGGSKLSVGKDNNGNGVLDSNEITGSRWRHAPPATASIAWPAARPCTSPS